MALPAPPTSYKPFLNGMRSPVVGPLTRFLIGVPLVFLTTRTADYFAWTIEPPMTAAFLGANYWASALLAILAARETVWAKGRVSVWVAVAFAPLTTLATLLHLDQFHLDTFFGWFWIVAYTIYPIQIAYFLTKQLKAPGSDPPRERLLPLWVRGVFGVQALVLIPLGVALFVAPGSAAGLWPWELPALSAQVVAAWCLAFGVLAAASIYENDYARTRCALLGFPFLGAMQALMLLRFSEDLRWEDPSAWVYVGFIASYFVLGAYGLVAESATQPGAGTRRSLGRRARAT